MKFRIYCCYGILGRCGTTFFRNLICKVKNVSCLTSDAQYDWINENKAILRNIQGHDDVFNYYACWKKQWIEKGYYKKDIKCLFAEEVSKEDKELGNILMFKLNLAAIYSMSEELPLFSYAVLMFRHPVSVVLSRMEPLFLNQAVNYEMVRSWIEQALKMFGKSYREPKRIHNALVIQAYLVKNSLRLLIEFMSSAKEYLVVYFEDFCSEFYDDNLLLFSQYFDFNPKKLIKLSRQPFYKNVVEEGGIEMSSLIDTSKPWHRHKQLKNTDPVILNQLWDILSEEAEIIGYAKYGLLESSYLLRKSSLTSDPTPIRIQR